jgi:FAD/FMN-containing dehydrogenase
MNNSTVTAAASVRADIDVLRAVIAGDVYAPADAGYDAARSTFNLALDLRPAAIVVAESSSDVVNAIRFARSTGLRIAPQGTSHGADALGSLDDAILLKTTRMRGVEIYPATRTARVEAGAEWQDVTVPAAEHGLAALAGSAPDVGVVGYTLGGGMGWLARRYGLSANSVVAVDIVTTDGRLVRADKHVEPDLFWAVCGGGGSVGVVTAIEIQLYPVREVYAGALFFPIERSSEVLHAWREWTDTVPDEVTSVGRIMQFPPIPEVPEPLRGNSYVLVEAAYLGDEFEGAELIRPLRELGPAIDTFGMIPAPTLQDLHMDPPEPVPYKGDGMFLADAPAGAIDALVAAAGPGSDSPLLSVEFRHLGGALAEGSPGAAQGRIDAKYAMFAVGMAITPEMGEAVSSHVRVVQETLAPWRAAYDYYNFAERHASAEEVLPADSYRRLREIKAKYDPTEMIVSAHPVRPAR